MKLKKAQLVRLEGGSLCLIPLEEVKNGLFCFEKRNENCDFIKINPPKVNLWIYRMNAGINCLGDENHVANPPAEDEISLILEKNNGICFLQVTEGDEIESPSNGLGYRSVLIRI